MGFFTKTKNDGSVFSKIAAHDVNASAARGRIIAADAAHDAARKNLAELHKETDRVHADSNEIQAGYDALLARL